MHDKSKLIFDRGGYFWKTARPTAETTLFDPRRIIAACIGERYCPCVNIDTIFSGGYIKMSDS